MMTPRLENKLSFVIDRLDRLITLMEEEASTGKKAAPARAKKKRGRPRKVKI